MSQMSKDITPSCPRSGTVPDCPVQGHVPSKYQHCLRHTIKRLIIDGFEEKRKIISNFFQNSTFKFSLTCDIWSSVKMESFMALTIHYIDSKWKLCHFVLDIFNFTGSHTGTAIFE